MIKSSIRFSLITLAALVAIVLPARAQAPTDYSKIEIKTTKIANNFYTLEGAGGMIGILTGPDGVMMVDAQYPQLTDKIVAAIKQVSSGPIKFLVNTHVHADHTSGDENFAKMGVVVFAREELRLRLAHPNPQANGQPGVPAPPMGLPVVTYTGRTHWYMNGENVELIPIPRAHTDGDTLVRFPRQDVIMSGDFYRSVGFPNIDRANGGSLSGMLNGLALLTGLAGPNTKIFPGHGPMVDRSAVQAHRDVILGVRARVLKLLDEGKSEQETVAAKPAAEFSAKIAQPGTSEDRFVAQVYQELKANR